MSTRLTPSESFPKDLNTLDLPEVEVLNSKVERELAHEYAHDGKANPETEFRSEELAEELDLRDIIDTPARFGTAAEDSEDATRIA